ncbi:putative WW domain-binding protein 11 [Hypsibius exemplaris]|uniref:WW domain-binding protein 11 n=1 Tax=Hypsibius exemplaris TaxID=2072580 RepID=A0A9X6NDJ2_HYPEX|nr:putative WW domain-binding protein 11 [Hypsibius exemplaris]
MGKRSTQNTKSGRAMNPADQARKEARRRELKKNKKQRLVVREAVIKAKDPKKVIEELERLDQMEYNINEAPPLPDHVLLERRRRLLGNFNRCLSLYEKDDKTTYNDLKKMLAQYHRKHDDLRKYYDSVKRAQSVTVDDIPLPIAMPDDDAPMEEEHSLQPVRHISQGSAVLAAPRMLSWEAFSDNLADTGGKRPPGPPCCPAPALASDDSDDEADAGDGGDSGGDGEGEEAASDEDVDEDTPRQQSSGDAGPSVIGTSKDQAAVESDVPPETARVGAVITASDATVSVSAMPRMTRPPGPTFGVGRPPFVPPGANFRNVPPPNMMQQRFPPPMPGFPGMPRTMTRPPGFGPIGPMAPGMRPPEYDPVMHRPPPLSGPSAASSGEAKTMIQAKPQLRNLTAEVTRFIPTSVKVKREEIAKPKPKPVAMGPNTELIPHRPAAQQQSKGSTDEAYDAFLKEMEGLL